jgi:hypothetical protein
VVAAAVTTVSVLWVKATMFGAVPISLCVVLGLAQPPDIPPPIQKYLAEAELERERETARLRARIDELPALIRKASRSKVDRNLDGTIVQDDGTRIFDSAEDKNRYRDELEAELKDARQRLRGLDDRSILPVPLLAEERGLRVGDIGRFPQPKVVVKQVIDESSVMVIRTWHELKVTTDAEGTRQEFVDREEVLIVSGVETAGLADRAEIELLGPFEATGTKSHTAPFTSRRTFLVVQPFDLSRLEPFVPPRR